MSLPSLNRVCAGGGNTLIGVEGDEDADESEHAEEDDGKDKVGDEGDANSKSWAVGTGSAG